MKRGFPYLNAHLKSQLLLEQRKPSVVFFLGVSLSMDILSLRFKRESRVLTCDLDVHRGFVVPRHILSHHCDLVDSWMFVAMLDGLIGHCQVLVDRSDPVTKVHLVLGAAGVALLGSIYHYQPKTQEEMRT